MNVILLGDEDFTDAKTVRFTGRRVRHMTDVLTCVPGDALIVGRVGGKLGQGVVQRISERNAELSVIFDRDPPGVVADHIDIGIAPTDCYEPTACRCDHSWGQATVPDPFPSSGKKLLEFTCVAAGKYGQANAFGA